MRFVTLLRHAKSSWDDLGRDDFERVLAPRGQTTAPLMGQYLAELYTDIGSMPDQVLCSPAIRAKQTFEAVRPHLAQNPDVSYEMGIYNAMASDLMKLIHQAPTSRNHLLLVGHNPGFHDLALRLTGKDPSDLHARMSKKFPTATIALMSFEADDWQQVTPEKGTLLRFKRPKDL